MKCYALVGAKRSGKTTLAKQIVSAIPAPSLVFDKNNEWGRPLVEMETFLEQARKVRGHVIVWEDATIFFGTTARHSGLLDVLVAARHTRNTSLLLFHSLRSLPLYVLDHLDGIFIMPTRDLPEKVEKRFGDWPSIVQGWRWVQAQGWTGGVRNSRFPRVFVPL